MARETLIPRLLSVIAACSSFGVTSSGAIAAQAGISRADPQPSANVKTSSSHAVVKPSKVHTPRLVAMSSIQTCAPIK
jgi:hypothetical protein